MATPPDEKAWGEGAVVPAKMFKLSKQTRDADVTSQNGQCRGEHIQNQDVGPTRYI